MMSGGAEGWAQNGFHLSSSTQHTSQFHKESGPRLSTLQPLHKGHGVAPLHEGHSVAPRDSWPRRAARPGSVPSGLEAVTAETTSSISTPRPK